MAYTYRFICASILMATPLWANAQDLAAMPLTEEPELVYELRTYTAHEGKLEALEQRFRDHTMALFEKHGIINISYWKPLDQPNTLIYLVAHPSQFAASRSLSPICEPSTRECAMAIKQVLHLILLYTYLIY